MESKKYAQTGSRCPASDLELALRWETLRHAYMKERGQEREARKVLALVREYEQRLMYEVEIVPLEKVKTSGRIDTSFH